jgi:hypothetical protein
MKPSTEIAVLASTIPRRRAAMPPVRVAPVLVRGCQTFLGGIDEVGE